MDYPVVIAVVLSVLSIIISSVSATILIVWWRNGIASHDEADEPQAFMYDEERIEMARAQIADSIGPGPMADNLARLRIGSHRRS